MSEKGGIYVPPSLSPNRSFYFAIDNVDFQIDTPDGKEQLHGITQVVFQEKAPNWNKSIERFKTNTPKNTKNVYNIIYCAEPKSQNETYLAHDDLVNYDKVNQYTFWDIAWALSRTIDSEKFVPTWSAHNSTNREATQLSKYFTTPVTHGKLIRNSKKYTGFYLSGHE